MKNCSQPIEISSGRRKTAGKTTRRKRDALALEHLDWARGIARKVATFLPTWFTPEDMTGAVDEALLHLAEQYDPQRGVPFRAFAVRRIYGACIDAVRRREYFERSHLSIDAGADPARQIHEVNRFEPACSLPSPETQASERQLDRREQRIVWSRVQQLPPRHALVILAVYGGAMTLEELATKVDVGASRLSQIHHEALRMLRESAERDVAADRRAA